MRGRRIVTLPRPPRTPAHWYAVALVVQSAFVAALIVFRIRYVGNEPLQTYTYLLDIPAVPHQAPPARSGAELRRGQVPPALAMPHPVEPAPPVPVAFALGADSLGLLRVDTLTGDPWGRPGATGLAAVGPRYGNGRLWVRPAPADAGAIDARPLDMDSIVRRRLLAMADSIERNPMVDPSRPPSWTFQRNGKTYGLDAAGLHLGGITIPSALLAFLPLPQGNIDQARANAQLAAMRADIMRAAARAQAEDDFRRAVRDIRARMDRERRERREREQADRDRERPVP